jgi:hypothetical protein
MLIFPDPSVSTEYTDPNGSVWEFNGTGWVRQPADNGGGIPPDADFDAGLDAVWAIEYPSNNQSSIGYKCTARALKPDLSEVIGEISFYLSDFGNYQELGTSRPNLSDPYASHCGDEEGNVYFVSDYQTSPYQARVIHKINRYGQHSSVKCDGYRTTTREYNLTVVDDYLYFGSYSTNISSQAPRMWRIPLTGAKPIGQIEELDMTALEKTTNAAVGFGRMEKTGQWFYGGAITGANGGVLFDHDISTGVSTKIHNGSYSSNVERGRASFAPRRNRWWTASWSPNKGASYYEMRSGPPYTNTRYVWTGWDTTGSPVSTSFLAGANGGLGSGLVLVSIGSANSLFIKDTTIERVTLDTVVGGSPVGPSTFGNARNGITESPINFLTYLSSSNGIWAINCDTKKAEHHLDTSGWANDVSGNYCLIHTSSAAQKQAGFTPLTTREQEEHDAESDRMYAAYVEGEIARIESELQAATGEEKDQLNEQLSFYKSERST